MSPQEYRDWAAMGLTPAEADREIEHAGGDPKAALALAARRIDIEPGRAPERKLAAGIAARTATADADRLYWLCLIGAIELTEIRHRGMLRAELCGGDHDCQTCATVKSAIVATDDARAIEKIPRPRCPRAARGLPCALFFGADFEGYGALRRR